MKSITQIPEKSRLVAESSYHTLPEQQLLLDWLTRYLLK